MSDKVDTTPRAVAANWRDASKEDLWSEIESLRKERRTLHNLLRLIATNLENYNDLTWQQIKPKVRMVQDLTQKYLDPFYD